MQPKRKSPRAKFHNYSNHYPYASVPLYVIMPNHIHAIISIDFELRTHEPCVPTNSLLSRVVAGLKRSKDRNEIANYIEDNITRWELHM